MMKNSLSIFSSIQRDVIMLLKVTSPEDLYLVIYLFLKNPVTLPSSLLALCTPPLSGVNVSYD